MWACRMVPAPGDIPGATPWKELRVGDMWFAPYLLEAEAQGRMEKLSGKYWAQHARRRAPLVVRLPGPCDFAVDTLAWRTEAGADGVSRLRHLGDGWDVSGEPPLLVVSPSINIGGTYHGYLGSNGVAPGHIGPDVEGRVYDADGRLMPRSGQ